MEQQPLGCSGYWSDGWNKLDGTIVTMSVVEMVMNENTETEPDVLWRDAL